MRVQVEGESLPPTRSRKARWLLALLALQNGQPVSREWIAGNLWPDAEAAVALANLRPIVSELRRALGGQGARLLTLGRKAIALDLEAAEVDVAEFDRALARGDLQRAVELYTGALLEDCPDAWAHQARDFREAACLEALGKLARDAEPETAVVYRRRAVAIAPLRDAPRRALMEALAQSGDLNAALETYRDFGQAIRNEAVGIPDAATTELYHRLRMEAGSKSRSARAADRERPSTTGYLPHPLTRIVGREDERIDIAERLGQHRLVTLTGFGGIGKTRLAREVAADLSTDSPDGVWFVALESATEGAQIAHRIAKVLGITQSEELVDHLRSRRALLILDNCEHLLEPVARLCECLLGECGDLRILATSREPLGIVGEKVWRTTPLSVPVAGQVPAHPATRLRVLNGYESIQLFLERAQAMDETFRLTTENAESVAWICAQLEGIPLAIELAAARIKAMTIEQILQRLQDPLSFLTHLGHSSVARQQTLRNTLDWSFGLLQPPHRALLSRVARFVGGWTLEAAESICAGGEIEASDVARLLASLVDKSLVVFERESPGHASRYRMLEPVRQYILTLPNEECPEFRERYLVYFRGLCELAEQNIFASEPARWQETVRVEDGNLRQALQWIEETPALEPHWLPLVSSWGRVLFTIGLYHEGYRHVECALRVTRKDPTAERAKALSCAASLAQGEGNFLLSLDLQREALAIFEALCDREKTAIALRVIGSSFLSIGRRRAALGYLERSYNIERELGKDRSAAISAINYGACLACHGDIEGALHWIEQGKSHFIETKEWIGIAWALNFLGNVYLDNDLPAQAIPIYAEGLRIELEHGPHRTVYSLDNLAKANSAIGDFESAQEYLDRAFTVADEVNDDHVRMILTITSAELAEMQGEYGIAKERVLRALGKLKRKECPYEALTAFRILASSQIGLGEFEAGLELIAAIDGLHDRMEIEVPLDERLRLDSVRERAEAELTPADRERIWCRGRALTMTEAFEVALKAGSLRP